jgi:hypothetical protein
MYASGRRGVKGEGVGVKPSMRRFVKFKSKLVSLFKTVVALRFGVSC